MEWVVGKYAAQWRPMPIQSRRSCRQSPTMGCGRSHGPLARASSWKTTLEVLMVANPDPNLIITVAQRDGAIVQGDAYRPRSRVTPQPFQAKTGMRLVFAKLAVGQARGVLDVARQLPVQSPELGCAPGGHERRSNSVSEVSGNAVGSRW